MEAAGERAYPDKAEVYRRMVMLIDAGEGNTYAVDLFRVTGGSQHDWALHGNADYDGTGEVSVPLSPYGDNLLPGVKIRYPAGEADRGEAEGRNPSYAFFQNVSRGEVADGVKLTFAVSESPVAVRTHLPGLAGSEVFLGDAPSFRRSEENDALLSRYRMPIFLLRRKGSGTLSSRFAAVHEPYSGEPFLDAVDLEPPSEESDAIILSVRYDEVTDHIVHWTGSDSGAVVAGDLRLRGQVGFVRERDGVPEMMGLWGGTEIRWGNYVLSGNGIYEAEVTGTLQSETDALIVAGNLPEGDALKGATAVITFADGSTQGCRVRGVEHTNGQTRLLLEDELGFVVENGGARHLYFPLREIPGRVTCRILTSAFVTTGDGKVVSTGAATFSAP